MVPRGPNPTHPAPILGEVELHIVAQGILIPSYIRKSAARPPLCLMQCVEARKKRGSAQCMYTGQNADYGLPTGSVNNPLGAKAAAK